MSKVRWGVIGTAKIGWEKVIPGMQRAENCEIIAIASRNLEKARQKASELGIQTAYGSYEDLLEDRDVDAVYIPLPNHMHVEWSSKALQAGKHVLCEKPIGFNAAEAQSLLDAAVENPRLKVMEAFMYRFHPQWQTAKRLVDEGRIGELSTIQTFFAYRNMDPNNIRNMADVGGGGLMDIGCYPISLSRFIFNREPDRVCATMEYDIEFRTDCLTSAILEFGDSTATFTCGTQQSPYQRVNIIGTEGRIEIEIPFNAPPDRQTRMWHQVGTDIEEFVFDACDHYTIQGDLFSRAVLEGTDVPTPLEDAVANMRVIDAIVRSAQRSNWESITVLPIEYDI